MKVLLLKKKKSVPQDILGRESSKDTFGILALPNFKYMIWQNVLQPVGGDGDSSASGLGSSDVHSRGFVYKFLQLWFEKTRKILPNSNNPASSVF